MTNSVRIKQEMLDSNPEDSGSEQVLDLRKSSTQIGSCTWCGKQSSDPQNQGVHKDFCSEICFDLFRRDSFKKRASCVWCSSSASAQSILTLNGATVDESKFCSPQCLTQFKVRVFCEDMTSVKVCEETSAHLSLDQLKEVNKDNKGKTSNSSSKDLVTPELWLKHSMGTSKPILTTTVGIGSGSRTTPNSSSSTNSEGSSSSSGGSSNLQSNGNSLLATLSRSMQSSSSSSGSRSNTGGSASTVPVIVSTPTSSPLFFSPVSSTTTTTTTTTPSSSSSLATGPPPRKRGRIPVPASSGSQQQNLRSPVSSEYFPMNLAGVCFSPNPNPNPNSHPSPSSMSNISSREQHQHQHHHRESSSSRSGTRRGNSHHNNSRVSMSRQMPNPNIISPPFSIPRMMANPTFPLTGFPFPPHLTHPHHHHHQQQQHQQQQQQVQQIFPITKCEMGVNTRISYDDDKECFLSDDISMSSTNTSHAVLWSSTRKKKSPVFKSSSSNKVEIEEGEEEQDRTSHMNEKSDNDDNVQEHDNANENMKCCNKNKFKIVEKNQSSKTVVDETQPCVSCITSKHHHHHHFPTCPSIIPIPIPIPIPIFIPFPINLSGNSRKTPSPIVSTANTNSTTIQHTDNNNEKDEEGKVIHSPSPTANTSSNNNNNNNNNTKDCANHENSENNNDQVKLKKGRIIQDIEEND